MAQDLFSEIKFLSKGDFTQEDVIEDNILKGKRLPTSESIFTSDKKQKVFLELWNETEQDINVFVRVGNKIYQNGIMCICKEEIYAHTFHQIEIEEGEEIFISSDKENSISYNIVL